ncbi:MAG: YgiQ family radical SAM protein [Candidatus Lernaella stagnicola]|nr:YgiQ family radical SAM protein [Candidatus Lernaella stagnicola]
MPHLPTTLDEAQSRGWNELDVILVTGDAHVDHPSFPAALLGRVLEAAGFRVGVIARPDVNDPADIARLGIPRLFFGVTAGSLDSMVGNYTALKRRRSDDPYAPGGMAGGRPDRALTVYCNLIRRNFGKAAFLVAGGLEAGLRRFAHYDYWSDAVRRSALMDCGADVLVHGMGEGPIVEIAKRLDHLLAEEPMLLEARRAGRKVEPSRQVAAVNEVAGVVYRVPKNSNPPPDGIALPPAEEVAENPRSYAHAHQLQETNCDRAMWQETGGMRVVANPPWPPLSGSELDRIYGLDFTLDVHPVYGGERVPALEQVRFGITAHRGCFGGCAFCAIGAHQGKAISFRSEASILDNVRRVVAHPDFRGTISDLGGPTANMYGMSCGKEGGCNRPSCLWPNRCRHLSVDATPYLELLRKASAVPGVKHLFVTTGIRTDLAVLSEALMKRLAAHHTSGLMKVAPEHVVGRVLDFMRKPDIESFVKFLDMHRGFSKAAGREQYVLPYFIAAHPGCTLEDMKRVKQFMRRHGLTVEQCQIFTPTPGTAATTMYATGLDPATLEAVYVERDPKMKQAQKDLILG